MSVTNYQSTLPNIPEEQISFTIQQKLEMKQLMLIHPLWCLNIYQHTHPLLYTIQGQLNPTKFPYGLTQNPPVHTSRQAGSLRFSNQNLVCEAWCPICAN